MDGYIVRGDEEIYNLEGELESERLLPFVRVSAGSVNEAYETGRKSLQKIVCQNSCFLLGGKMHVVRVDLIFDKSGRKILYQSHEIDKQNESGKNEKFDLMAAIRDGCPIDESGAGTCGG